MADSLVTFLSAANFQAAWQKVAANQGCAGVDRETILQFRQHADRQLQQLRQAVLNGTYRPLPLRQIFIPKPDQTWRELRVPTVRDRIVQQALLNVLHPLLDPQFEESSFAYRPGRSHKLAVEQVSAWQRRGYRWVLDADIVKYFDHIQHPRLLDEVIERLPTKAESRRPPAAPKARNPDRKPDTPTASFPGLSTPLSSPHPATPLHHSPAFHALALHLLQQWIAVGVLTREGLLLPDKGIPQGSVVSPILANVYLDDFDEALLDTPLKLVRYADDFVILGRRQPQIIAAQQQVADLLADIGLRLHADKTQITHFNQGFQFLGHAFVGDLVVPVKKARRPPAQSPPQSSDLRLVHADAPSSPTQLQQSLLAALQASQRPIPPPLFVALGYRVRREQSVAIKSSEAIWRSGMSTLYLVQQGATVKKEQGRYVVKAPQEAPLEIPVREVERLLVFGNVQLTTAVMSECLDHQVPVVFMSQLGDYKGHLWSAEYDDIRTELMQYQRQSDEAFKLMTARAIVRGKLMNSRQLLLRLNRKRQLSPVAAAIEGLTQDLVAIEPAATLNALRGHEGIGAARYFKALGQLIVNDAFTFTERNRRPPKDPVNSLLSFGYTLLFNNVLSLILAEGLNPYLGNLHGSEKKKTFLAFDLMEEFRSPIVDSLVLKLINRRIFLPTDFTWPTESGGIYLANSARRTFIQKVETRLGESVSHPDVQSSVSYRRAIQLQIQRYKRCLQEGSPYAAFLRAT